MSESSADREVPSPPRAPWERPSATFVGRVSDLVRGAGKISGPANDSDQVGFRKSPGTT